MVRVIAICLALVAATIGTARVSAFAQSDLVKRGDYLVNTIMTCANCHSPKGPPAAVAGKDFSGGLSWDEAPFKVTAPNITQDKETGIGAWSDADIRTLMRTGKRPNGVQIAEIMPTAFYGIVTDGDMDAIVAYLRTLAPVANKVPDPIYRMQIPHLSYPGAETPYTEEMLKEPVKKGFYLATIGHCMECHTPMGPRGRQFADKLGTGGFEFPGPWGVTVSKNITQSKPKGIGEWTDAEIITAVTTGVDRKGGKLKPPMGFQYYAHMTSGDLDALVAYLRTVPPNE
jgi:mono/diheme cytochrome c family protein